jgi:hypothetical protein
MEEPTTQTPWWGKFTVGENTTAHWRVGPLEFWVTRSATEWLIGTYGHGDSSDRTLIVNNADSPSQSLPNDEVEWQRFGFRQTTETIALTPLLAPRSLVVKPEIQFVLPPKEEVTLFIGSPLWIQFELGQPPSNVLERVIFRPSDTWFGPSTMDGELCYAGRTRARLRLDELDVLPHRAVTALRIRNDAESILVLDRLKLPMPNLSVYSAADGRLWTEAVTFKRREDGDLAELKLGEGPPPEVQPAQLQSGPRTRSEKGLLIKAFGGLFG